MRAALTAALTLPTPKGFRVEDAYDINNTSVLTDGNNRSVTALDVVEYGDRFRNSWTPRRGILLDLTHDGDAWVLFRDTKKVEIVKWMNLCKVPSIDEIAPTPKGKHIEDVYPDEAVAWRWWDTTGYSATLDGNVAAQVRSHGFIVEPLVTADAKQQGIAEERERCAKIADRHANNFDGTRDLDAAMQNAAKDDAAEAIAAAIRGAS